MFLYFFVGVCVDCIDVVFEIFEVECLGKVVVVVDDG